MAEESSGEKTEQATPKKRQELRDKGEVAKSRELPSVAVLLSALIALSLFKTPDSINIPCSENANGGYLEYLPLSKVANCDLKETCSFVVNSNIKVFGKRSIFLLTRSFNLLVSTP